MTRPSPSDTPQELIDEIIDHCSGDKRTLKACSLTSRAWVHRTRKHLFSKLMLTDRTLPVWCGIVVTPTATGSKPQPLPGSYPPVSSSYASSRLSSYVTSLQLVPKYSRYSSISGGLGAKELLLAKSHLSAFTHLESVTLAAISFIGFDDASLEACFGSLAGTVHELKLWMCLLDEQRFCAFLRLFTRLKSFVVNGNVWLSSESTGKAKTLPTLRGSFTASEFTDENDGLLDILTTTRAEYHTISLGYNFPPTFHKLNVLFSKCKSHLETVSFTALEWGSGYRSDQTNRVLDLSPCEKLAEIQAHFNHGDFGKIVHVLRTVGSPRFRRLTLFITPPIGAIRREDWTKLEGEVIALAKRVNATAVNDTLQVLFSSYSTPLGELVLSDIESVLPRVASDVRVSLRVENPPLPPNH